MARQIVVIRGGETFDTYDEYLAALRSWEFSPEAPERPNWKRTLSEDLGEGYEVLMPSMPNKLNAKYLEWKIWFEKVVPFIEDGAILIGSSLGGIFLAKYLSEEEFPKAPRATLLFAAPFDATDSEYGLADFVLPQSLHTMQEQAGAIHLFHSTDDPVVPFVDLAKYEGALPGAVAHVFSDRGHFGIEEFPEALQVIRSLG